MRRSIWSNCPPGEQFRASCGAHSLLREQEPDLGQAALCPRSPGHGPRRPGAGPQALEEAILREPALGICWYTLTMFYSMTGEPEAALAAAERALREFSRRYRLMVDARAGAAGLDHIPEARTATIMPPHVAGDDMPWFYLGRLLLLELDCPLPARGALKEALRLVRRMTRQCGCSRCAIYAPGSSNDGFQLIQRLLSGDPSHLWGHLLRAAWHVQRANGRGAARPKLCGLPGV